MEAMESRTEQGEAQISAALVQELKSLVDRPIRVMVVCGTQNRTLLKYGLEEVLPDNLDVVAGPGCSVCVMPAGHIDAFVKIGLQPDVITATCEDLLRVSGSRESLDSIRRKGAQVEVVDSPMEALDLARKFPDKIVVFTAVGFEGAAPDVAETILEAACQGVSNFCVIPSIRLLPPSLASLLRDPELNIRGLLFSSHIESITDSDAYANLARQHHLACAVAGFGINDILNGLIEIVRQVRGGRPLNENPFAGITPSEETARVQKMLSEVFFAVETDWRGLGSIEGSGFVIREELSLYDAVKRFNIRFLKGEEQIQCQCAEIISGRSTPNECPAFGISCTSQHPIGPCMVAQEGICASYFRYTYGRL
ncbi:hydrogenase formation protein HypD [Desulfofustis limnaeus]|uniref:Hydrogenase formation protein HypD n=1 Tax=Desulfofustis limnaeus TaxID=2740163 RepID=A0ABM7WC55_9BACT|nr:hydrogenase formation protein HypD [Desulfofustis limnaeus]BDD88530.1 hydrogenase formation protein HypD [Desulfofustis limnaeus]